MIGKLMTIAGLLLLGAQWMPKQEPKVHLLSVKPAYVWQLTKEIKGCFK